MKLKQLSVFLENKPGRLREACAILAEERIRLITLSLADTEQFGILRLIVNEPDRAREALEAAGFVAKITETIAVEVPADPQAFCNVLHACDEAELSVEYMSAFTCRVGKHSILLLRFDDMPRAIDALQTAGYRLVTADQIYRLSSEESV